MSQPQPNIETLSFNIGISGTFWNKAPAYSIWLNDTMQASGVVDTKDTVFLKFSADVVDGVEHVLKIRLENKTDKDTVVDNDVIVKDMLLNIVSIEIDDLEIGDLKWNASLFVPDDTDNRPVLQKCVNLGWNGSYILKFESPFYLWLLERL